MAKEKKEPVSPKDSKGEDIIEEVDEKLDIEDIKDPEEVDPEEVDIEEAIDEGNVDAKEEDLKTDEPVETPQKEVIVQKEEITKVKKEKLPKIKKPKKPFPLKTVLIVVVTILLTTALVLGGVYYYMNYYNKKEEPKTEETQKVEEPKTEATNEENIAYVTELTGLNLREEPNPSATLIVLMPFGSKLKVLKEENGWLQVEYDGKTGWCSKEFTASVNPMVYNDKTYGYEITFPSGWETYKLFPISNIEGAEAAYYVALATKDTNYTETGVDDGYASLFAITVYTKEQWTGAQAQEGPAPTKIAENDKYVIAYSLPNGGPASDLTTQREGALAVIKTIKF